MTLAERKEARSKAAYSLVDISDLPRDVRDAIIEDAQAGGGEYGVRVVEEMVNGPVRSPIYGVYDFDAEKWDAAKAELGIVATDIPDNEVQSETDVDEREDAQRAAARESAQTEAARIREAEEAEVRRVTKEDEDKPDKPKNKAPR